MALDVKNDGWFTPEHRDGTYFSFCTEIRQNWCHIEGFRIQVNWQGKGCAPAVTKENPLVIGGGANP